MVDMMEFLLIFLHKNNLYVVMRTLKKNQLVFFNNGNYTVSNTGFRIHYISNSLSQKKKSEFVI